MRHKVARPLQRVVAIASLSVCFAVVGVVVLGHNCWSTWLLQVSGKPLIQVYRTHEVAVKTRVATKSRQTSEQAAFSTSGLNKRKCYGAVRNIAAKRERAWHNKVLSSVSWGRGVRIQLLLCTSANFRLHFLLSLGKRHPTLPKSAEGFKLAVNTQRNQFSKTCNCCFTKEA